MSLPMPAAEQRSVTILLVEDNPLNADMLSRRLRKRGFVVVHVASGLQAIECAHGDLPDVILMDIDLPDIDGWEATRRLRASSRTEHVPIIALTAHAMVSDREKSLAIGCDEFETKPIDIARLLEKISHMIAQGRPA